MTKKRDPRPGTSTTEPEIATGRRRELIPERVELSSEEPHHGWVLVTRGAETGELFGFFTTVRKALLTMYALKRYDFKPEVLLHPAVLMHNEILWSSEEEEKAMKDLSAQVCITPWEMNLWKEELVELRAAPER